MLTRRRWTPPADLEKGGEGEKIVASLAEYLRGLEAPGALEIQEARIGNSTINGSSVGGTTAAAGEFTTLSASGLISADGGQIKFPATQAASSNANTLDDYEEVPSTATSASPQGGAFTATASYKGTKVGNLVSVEVSCVISNVGTGTGVIDVNIPFLPALKCAGSAVNDTSLLGLSAYAHNNGGQGQVRIFKPDGTTAIAVATLLAQVTFAV